MWLGAISLPCLEGSQNVRVQQIGQVVPEADALETAIIDSMTYQVRSASDGDYEEVNRLWLELNAHHVEAEPELIQRVPEYQDRPGYERVLGDPQQDILVLCDESEILAAAWLEERKHEGGQAIEMRVAFILEICTKETSRNRGLGRMLMQAIEEWAKERQLERIEFNVWANNSSAIAFYESLGFRYARHEMFKKLKQ